MDTNQLPSLEISKNDIKILKGVAILFMLLLHLFCRKDINGLYETVIEINGVPLIYYLALFGDACVSIYCFSSGYGLFKTSAKEIDENNTGNTIRIIKLLINYWIVLLIFVTIGFLAGKAELFPGGLLKFILNFTLIAYSYNGAWWFLQTYIVLIFLSPLIFKAVIKYNSIGLLIVSISIYLFSHLQRFRHVIDIGNNPVINAIVNIMVLVGTSQLPFIVGAIFAHENLYTRLCKRIYNLTWKNWFCFLTILTLVIVHAFYESVIIAPFTAVSFICMFNLMDKKLYVRRILRYFGLHSTNIWLTHMFFYGSIFPEITFAPRYPILIFIWLIVLCIISSHAINIIYKPILLKIETYIFVKRRTGEFEYTANKFV